MTEFDPSKPFKKLPDEFDPSKPFRSLPESEDSSIVDELAVPLYQRLGQGLQKIDNATIAPVRAGVGAVQDGGNFVDAATEQFKAGMGGDLLPSTPSWQDIGKQGAMEQGIAEPFAEGIGQAAGLAADVATDPLNFVPSGAVQKAGKIPGAIADGVSSLAKGAGDSWLAKKYMAAEGKAASAVAWTAPRLTRVLSSEKAMQMFRDLNAREIWFPGSKEHGRVKAAMVDVGMYRRGFREVPISVPGSHDVMQQVKAVVLEGVHRTGGVPTEEAKKVLDMIERSSWDMVPETVETVIPDEVIARRVNEISAALEQTRPDLLRNKQLRDSPNISDSMKIEQQAQWKNYNEIGNELGEYQSYLFKRANPHAWPDLKPFTRKETKMVPQRRDLTLDELDDIYQRYNAMGYTKAGNERAMDPVWRPFAKDARKITDEIMQSVPEGKVFRKLKDRQESLMIAGKERSALVELGADMMAIEAAKDLLKGDLVSAMVGAITQTLTPAGITSTLGAIRAPRDFVATITLARRQGSATAVRDAVKDLAQKDPWMAERFVRAVTLVTGKPALQQFLTEEEAATLGKTRIFDPEQVLAEKMRLQNDRDMPSGEKARKLSEINRNGYVTMDGPTADLETEEPHIGTSGAGTSPIMGGEKGLKDLIQSLKGH